MVNNLCRETSLLLNFPQMKRIFVSILIGFCIFLSNVSSQAKSYKIVNHLTSDHSVSKNLDTGHHHHHGHNHHHTKKSKEEPSKSDRHKHRHSSELSSLAIHLVLPDISFAVTPLSLPIIETEAFYSLNVLSSLSFTSNIFRPPIA